MPVHPDERTDAISWTDLRLVAIETQDGGPLIEDVYFYLEGPEDGCYISQGAEGTDELLDRPIKLPGFSGDNSQQAMCSASNTRSICWQVK